MLRHNCTHAKVFVVVVVVVIAVVVVAVVVVVVVVVVGLSLQDAWMQNAKMHKCTLCINA